MKILTVIGARPQFIKAATVSRQIAMRDDITEVIVHTGQHYDADMCDIFFEELNIPCPDYNLGIGGGTHGAMTGRQIEAVERVIMEEQPDWVLVYGDTNSTLAGALAAVKLHLPVAHVEAGLRSFNRRMPEEINRVLTDHVATLLFAPTETAKRNLLREGITESAIHLVGDVMYDAALFYRERAHPPDWFATSGLEPGEFVLATVHRAENTDDEVRLRAIFEGLAACGRSVVVPLHPRTRKTVERTGLIVPDHVQIVPPVGYLEMIWLEMNCAIVATDSGGMQKEAYFHGKPCVTLRDETEWVELVDAGWNRLSGSDQSHISKLLKNCAAPVRHDLLYGRGDASIRVFEQIASHSRKSTLHDG